MKITHHKSIFVTLFITLVLVIIAIAYSLSIGSKVDNVYQAYNFEAKVVKAQEDRVYLKDNNNKETIGIITPDTSINYKVVDLDGDIKYLPGLMAGLVPNADVEVRTFVDPVKTSPYEVAKISIIVKQQ